MDEGVIDLCSDDEQAPQEASEAPEVSEAPPSKRQKTATTVRIATWNAQSVLPSGGDNKDKLQTTLELLGYPDILAVQETLHVRKTKEKIDDAKTAKHTAAIAAKAKDLGYEALFASPDPTQYKGNDQFCHGTAMLVKRDGPLAGGSLVAVPWDHDGHVLCYDHDLGRVVGVYLPTPTTKSRFAGTPFDRGYPQSAVRSMYDRELRSLLVDSGDKLLAFLGDMNVTPTQQDTTGALWKGKNEEARGRFLAMTRDAGLVDAFREKHPTARRYTSYQLPKRNKCHTWDIPPARVDLCYVPASKAPNIRSAEIMDADGTFTTANKTKALRSDHVPVLVEIDL